MSSPNNFMELCRLCLVKEKVSIPIFEGEGDARQICVKIAACLPVKVEKNDQLPKKICDSCLYKVENVYQFWNTTADSEKQLRQWLGEAKKVEGTPPEATALETGQLTLKVEAPDPEHNTSANQSDPLTKKSEGEDSLSEDDDDDDAISIDDDTEGPGKEEAESEEDGFGELEPTTFVNVSMACDDQAGPSGLQSAGEERVAENVEASKIDTLSVNPPEPQPQEQLVAGTAPSTSKVVPVPSGFPTDGFLRTIWSDGLHCRQPPVPSNLQTNTGKRRYVKSGKYSKKKRKEPAAVKDVKEGKSKDKDEEKPGKEKVKGLHTCGECGQVFGSFEGLDNHMEEHGSHESWGCSECGKVFSTKKILKRHLVVHSTDRPYNCDICNKTFKRPYDITIHKKKHTGENKHFCDLCDYSTIYRSALATHRKRHFEEFKYRCEICGKGFFVLTWLEEHRNYHTGERPFQCDICGKAFPYTRYLVAHKKANHPDAQHPPKVNQCETCGKIFAHKKSLSLHVKGHTGENICLCDICGKALTNREHLKFHRRIHTGEKPNVCSVCGKAFSKRCNLKLHERTHTGERPYTCEECGKSFTQRSTLVIHKRYHSGQRPYVCHLCQKGFVCKALLNAHQKTKCI